MAILRRSNEIPSGLSPILLPGEQLVTAVHSHWARLLKPVSITALALTLAIVIDVNLTPSTQAVGNLFWLLFFATLAWLLWRILEWRNDWFVATDKRLLLRYGIITHKVAMMPLIKVTDMSYVRSIAGMLLGYGKFIMESAGQDQALRTVEWVPRPDETYRAICAVIFNIGPPRGTATVVEVKDEPDAGPGEGTMPDDGSGGSGGPGGPRPTDHGDDGGSPRYGTPAHPDVPPIHNPIQDRLDRYSRAIPIRRVRGGESLYESEDIRRRRRSADTGPVPIRPQDRRPRHEPRTD
ncbi:PH domain-containing protein [Intrasporangium calvum]|uniref:PH domain-containing protein n=1 Tax=Intrasporangium calvum TaxID=53358 RepID=A0ABT5GM29_9MICO|nr:PH domain-containing protein [Intrasporangium calvum]MDC5699101.1 PH domain-containing protein [Intrasporangium calvum]